MLAESNIDKSTNESEWQQTELRFSSQFDGKFNFTFGMYENRLDQKLTTILNHQV